MDKYELENIEKEINETLNASGEITYSKAVGYLRKIIRILKNNNIKLSIDNLIEIQNIELVSKILQVIVNKNMNFIIKGNIDILFNDDDLNSFIMAYCACNDIEIEDSESFSDKKILEDNKADVDILKLYLKEISIPVLTKEEEQKLFIEYNNGSEKARKKIIEHNLRLVVNIAKSYSNAKVPFLDIIQDGNLGLMKAIEHFDVSLGYKFSTYAVWWIKQSIQRELARKQSIVKVPVDFQAKKNYISKIEEELEKELGRKPTIKEIADAIDESTEYVKKILYFETDVSSLNEMVGDEGDSELGNFIATDDISPENSAINTLLSQEIQKLFDDVGLSKKEKYVLNLLFGLNGGTSHTLEEVGNMFGVTRERIRQIGFKALRKIRSSPYVDSFNIYVNENANIKRKHR